MAEGLIPNVIGLFAALNAEKPDQLPQPNDIDVREATGVPMHFLGNFRGSEAEVFLFGTSYKGLIKFLHKCGLFVDK